MLEKALGSSYTPDVAEAWRLVYDVLRETMVAAIQAAEAEEADQAQLRSRLLGDGTLA